MSKSIIIGYQLIKRDVDNESRNVLWQTSHNGKSCRIGRDSRYPRHVPHNVDSRANITCHDKQINNLYS